jgi:charged multivesicular body protein 2A
MASMNRGLNLPAIQRIMTEFERESSMMDMKEEMMSDAVDDVMEDEEEDEEEEGDKILKEVLDEIGVGLSQQVRHCQMYFRTACLFSSEQLTDAPTGLTSASSLLANKQPVALGESSGTPPPVPGVRGSDKSGGDDAGGGGGASTGSGGISDEDALQARLDALRRG